MQKNHNLIDACRYYISVRGCKENPVGFGTGVLVIWEGCSGGVDCMLMRALFSNGGDL